MTKRKDRFSIIAILVIVLIFSISANIFFLYEKSERNRVIKVVDGDSFDLKDGRRIRLLGIDAPERNRCFYQQAHDRLTDLIAHKKVRLTSLVSDDYGRILAYVFVNEKLINEIMVREGLAKFSYIAGPHYQQLKESSTLAQQEQIGIYSPVCRKTVSANDCQIKGNLRAGEKIYHLPLCKNYFQVIVDEAFGDQWFCTEAEAQGQGFRKASGCP